jgi:membrane protein
MQDRVGEGHLVGLIRRVLREQSAEQVGLAAAGAAFWLVIAALPTAIAVVSVYGLARTPQTVAKNLAGMASNGPQSLGGTLSQPLQKVAATDHRGLTAGLVISAVFAIWSASAGVYNLERAIRAAYGFPPEQYLRARGRALVGTVLVVLGLGVVAFLSTVIAIAFDHVPAPVAVVVATPVLVGVAGAGIAALYRYSVGHALVLRHQIPGALTASVALGVVGAAFVVYIHFSTRYTAVYGALAGTVIAMIGTYLAVYVVLLGAVLNAQLGEAR